MPSLPSSSSSSSDSTASRPFSTRFRWPFSLQAFKKIDEFRLSDKDGEATTEELGSGNPTASFRFVWPFSLSKFEQVDEFRLPVLQPEGNDFSPKSASKRSYAFVWPFSWKAFASIDEFRVPSVGTKAPEKLPESNPHPEENHERNRQPKENTETNPQPIETHEKNPQLTRIAVESLREKIQAGLVRSEFDRKEFLPIKVFRKLLNKQTISACFPAAPEDLINWINDEGRRVFATVLLCTGLDSSALLSLLESFHRQKFRDTELPIAHSCPPECINEDKLHIHTLSDTHLLSFSNPFWKSYMIRLFYQNQWVFLSPIFREDASAHSAPHPGSVLHKDSVLPFTSLNGVVQQHEFYTIYHASMPIEHQSVTVNVRCYQQWPMLMRANRELEKFKRAGSRNNGTERSHKCSWEWGLL